MRRIMLLAAAGAMLFGSAALAEKRLPKDTAEKDLVAFIKQAGGDLTKYEEFMGVYKGAIGPVGLEMVKQESGESLDALLKKTLGNERMNCTDGSFKTEIVEQRKLDGPTIAWWRSTSCQATGGGVLAMQGIIVVDRDRNEDYRLTASGANAAKADALARGIYDALVKALQ